MMRVCVMLICMGIFSFSAFGQEISPKSEPVTISLWTEAIDIQRPVWSEWIANFQEEYPWITVEYQGFDNEIWEETLRKSLFGGEPPDIFVTESRAELLEYVNADLIYDLTDWYNTYAERFIPGYEFYSVIKGRRYALPWTVHVLDLLWYNTTIMEKHGLDPSIIKTWDDLTAMCETLKQRGETPFAFGGGGAGWTGGHWVMFLLQKNLPPEDIMKLARREKKWTDPDVVAALSHFEEFVKKRYFASGAAQNDRNAGRALYFQGQGAFWQAGSWHLYQKGNELVPTDWKFTFIPFPNFAGTPIQDVAISANTSQWAIHKKSKHSDEALLFLEFITRPKSSAELWVKKVQGVVTVRGAVNERTAGTEMIAIARYLESSNVVTALEFYFPREVVQDGYWKGSTRVLSGQITTQEWAELIEELHKASGTLMLE